MKKLCSVLLAVLLLTGLMTVGAAAETASVTVSVDIAKKGELVFAQSELTVTDLDRDGTITIGDALWAAHEAGYTGGASAGYAQTVHPSWGLSIVTLWGDNSGNFGYYLNNQMPLNLAVELNAGDHITAYVYKQDDYSDTYCYFNNLTVSAEAGKTVALELKGFINWSSTAAPIADATVTVNGEDTAFKTDAEGKVTVTLPEQGGNYVISAKSDSLVLVPPVCHVTVAAQTNQDALNSSSSNTESASSSETSSTESTVSKNETAATTSPKTGDVTLPLCAVLAAICGGAALVAVRAKVYEK